MVLLPSSGGAESSSGGAQGTAAAGPCSRNQMGTFLEHGKDDGHVSSKQARQR